MDGLFYNEALDGVLNHQHHHHHQHHQHHHQQQHHHHHHDHNHPPPPPPPPPPHSHHGEAGGSGFESLSRNLSLNLADAPDALTLTSPDLQLLKLSSPELERLIIQSCNGLAPSTPSTGPARAFPAAKPEAGEHDAFDALHEFQHRMAGHPDTDDVATGPSHVSSTNFAEHLNHTWGDAMYTDVPPCALPAAPPLHPPPPPPHHHQQFGCAPALKDESQKVPETPPLSPIDMEDQERIKAERKRMRNRVAASKCRKRKLERLARLEERVSRLTGENGELRSSAETLRDQVTQLRHQLLDHIKSGCKLLSQQLQTVKEF